MEIVRLEDTVSTNDYLMALSATPEGREWEGCVMSSYQSRGKGCGTNRWESEAGKNLLFSILIHPTWLEPSAQFLLSMAEALALYDVLSEYADGFSIKWPNDIYWQDKKISGTLIEGSIKGGKMSDMVIGTGININQEVFLSDAPNPVSLKQISGRDNDPFLIMKNIVRCFEHYYEIAKKEWAECEECTTISRLYHKHLYRLNEEHWYEDEDGKFVAKIISVHPNGIMTLQRTDGTLSQYEFKEVRFII